MHVIHYTSPTDCPTYLMQTTVYTDGLQGIPVVSSLYTTVGLRWPSRHTLAKTQHTREEGVP